MPILAPFSRPLYVMAKPVGSLCNLQCEYCYYLEKKLLYASNHIMDDRTLEEFIRQYIEAQTLPQVLFTWHGGEPLMRPPSFYKRVMELQRKHARGHHIDNCLQTNGTLLTDDWCEFFRTNNWLIGISIDGPQELHDRYRRTPSPLSSLPTSLSSPPSPHSPLLSSFQKVMRGIRLLKKHGVEWNAMGVVNVLNADHPLDVYHFYKENGCQYIQFTPVVERLLPHPDGRHLASPTSTAAATIAPYSVRPGQYARFCCAIFDEWVRHDVGRVFIQLFDSTLARWVGAEAGVCSMGETCGHAAVIEANGDVYSCDHFVFPEYRLGNIHTDTITSMMYGERQRLFGQAKRTALPHQCQTCQWLFACNGGCPKDRFVPADNPQPSTLNPQPSTLNTQPSTLNYLCQDYRQFFAHVAPYMDFMKQELLHQRPPANVMNSSLCK